MRRKKGRIGERKRERERERGGASAVSGEERLRRKKRQKSTVPTTKYKCTTHKNTTVRR